MGSHFCHQARLHGGQNPNRLSAPVGVTPPTRKSWAELTQESSVIQQEMDAIQSRLTEIAEQKRELAGELAPLSCEWAGGEGCVLVSL